MSKVRCMFCFEEFLPKEAHFRAKSPVKEIGGVIIRDDDDDNVMFGSGWLADKSEKEERPLDEKLMNYYINIQHMDTVTAKNNAHQLPFFIPSESTPKKIDEVTKREYIDMYYLDRNKYSSSIMYTDERLCPHCHNKLPKGFGIRDVLFISVIGDTFSGKTVYLTVFLNELIKGTNHFNATLRAADESNHYEYTLANINELYNNKQLPDATQKEHFLQPLIYNYAYEYVNEKGTRTATAVDIILFDIAGENCRRQDTLDRKGLHLKYSNGIILIINPLGIDKIYNYMRHIGGDRGGSDTNSQLSVLDAIYNNFLGNMGKKSDIPIALVISQIDRLWDESVNIPYFTNHPFSPMLVKNSGYEDKHYGYLNKAEIQDFSDEIEEFLKQNELSVFVNSVRNYFNKYSFFAVSALGQKPIDEVIDGIKTNVILSEPRPFRVLEPFYWILAQNGCIKSLSNSVETKPKAKKKWFWSK